MATTVAEQLGPPILRIDENLHRVYTTEYQVFGSYGTGPKEVSDAQGIPPYGSPMLSLYVFTNDVDEYATCIDIAVGLKDRRKCKWEGGRGVSKGTEGYLWRAVVTHSTKSRKRTAANPRQNPLDEPIQISGSFLNTVEEAWRDKDGNVITFSNGAPIDPPFEIDRARDTITLIFNTASINLVQRATMIKKVNSAAIWGLSPRQVKLERWDFSLEYWGVDSVFVRNQLEFHINYERHPGLGCAAGSSGLTLRGYYSTRRNESYRIIDCPGYEPVETMMDDIDHPRHEPTSLDCTNCPSEDDYWMTYAVEEEADFNEIEGVPNPLPGPFA